MTSPRYEPITAERKAPPKSAHNAKRFYRTNTNGLFESPIKQAFNQPSFNRLDGLTIRDMTGIKEAPAFGIDLYDMPVHSLTPRITHFAPSRSKNICFTDLVAKGNKYKPGPALSHLDWRKQSAEQKGRFGKYKKKTFIQEIQDACKGQPGPGQHKPDFSQT